MTAFAESAATHVPSHPSGALFAACFIVAALVPDAYSLERAGNSAAVRGQVARANEEHPVGLQLASGEPNFLADRISSGANSGMQIMLLDQTTFTIGPDSFVTIDEFVYDPTTNVGKVTATLGKGVFRFVTGKIAQADPASMTVKLPVATIGIRGTMVYGRSTENSALVALAGAGPDNNTHDKPAAIDVITPEGTVKIRRPGWGAIVERGKPPIAQKVPAPTLGGIIDEIAPRELVTPPPSVSAAQQAAAKTSQAQQQAGTTSKPGGGGGTTAGGSASASSANNASGQSSASALPSLATFNVAQSLGPNQFPSIIKTGGLGSSQSSESVSGSGPTSGTPAVVIPDGQTSFGNLRSVTSGIGTFIDTAVPILFQGDGVPIGSYNFRLDVNFGSKTITASWNVVTTSIFIVNQTLSINNQSYAASNPAANANFTVIANCAGSFCQGDIGLSNASGIAAKKANSFFLVEGCCSFASGSRTVTRP